MSHVKQAVTHNTGPLLWTIAIYAMSTTCSTKMAKELPQQQQLQLGLCLFPHFTATTTLNPLLLYFYLSFHIPFCFTILFFLTSYGSYWQAAAILGQGYKAKIQWMVRFMFSHTSFYAFNFPCLAFVFLLDKLLLEGWVSDYPCSGILISIICTQ